MRAHSENAAKVAKFLDGHPKVLEVYYPGLEGRPGHEVARRQMERFGGMLSFRVGGGREEAFRVAASTTLFTRATSLGSYESLIEHRASIEGAESQTPDDLLRVSVGLEHADDLIADLEQALGQLKVRAYCRRVLPRWQNLRAQRSRCWGERPAPYSSTGQWRRAMGPVTGPPPGLVQSPR